MEAQRVEAEFVANEVAKGKRYKANAGALLEKARAEGRDPKLVIPHPDDIVVTEGKGWDINGPMDEEGLERMLDSCAFTVKVAEG